MKMQIETTKRVTEEVEIEFPIFRCHLIDHDGHSTTEIYTRIDRDGDWFISHSVTIRHDWERQREFEIEIERLRSLQTGSTADYTLGRGEYESSREDFEAAAAKALAAAQKIVGFAKP